MASDPFANDRPETLEHTLDAGATCIAYNRGGKYTGALLASGRFDGFVNVWDMLTLAPLRVFEGHVKAVSTVRCVGCSVDYQYNQILVGRRILAFY